MEHKRNKKDKRNNFTFQYGSTLIYSCQFRIFFMLICSFLSTSLYLFYFPIHFIMFFIKKPLIPFIYIPLSTSSHFYFIEHRQNFSLLIYIIYKFYFIISHFIISSLHNFNFFAWTQNNSLILMHTSFFHSLFIRVPVIIWNFKRILQNITS